MITKGEFRLVTEALLKANKEIDSLKEEVHWLQSALERRTMELYNIKDTRISLLESIVS